MDLGSKTMFALKFGGFNIAIKQSVVVQWIIMLIILVLTLALTSNLKKIPNKKQSVVEMIVNLINGLVKENMGDKFMNFVPIIGSMAVFILFLNLTGLVGVEPVTKDISVTAGFAIVSAFLINVTVIKRTGIGGYLKSIFGEGPIMAPMNILEKFTVPISLCLRLFINMLVGAIVISLVYATPAKLIIPIPLHGFFDMFDGVLQAYVFILLTMIFTKLGMGHE